MRYRQASSQGTEPHIVASSYLEQLREEEQAGTTFYGLQVNNSAPQISARDCLLSHAEIIAGASKRRRVQALDARAFAAPKAQQPLQLAPIPSVVPPSSLQESYTTLLPEEEQLLQLARQYGKPWSSIHQMLPHKAERDLRKHYNAVIKPKEALEKAAAARQAESQLENPEAAPSRRSASRQRTPGLAASRSSTPPLQPSTDLPASLVDPVPQPAQALLAPSRQTPAVQKPADSRRTPPAPLPVPSTPGTERPPAIMQGAPAATAGQPSAPSSHPQLPVERSLRCLNRAGGETRVQLTGPLAHPPHGNTVARAHGLSSLAGVTFYSRCLVRDPDDPRRVYRFSTADKAHCASFNIGDGHDGSPLISWSDLHHMYTLPDGSKWAEHGLLYDSEDLAAHAAKKGVIIDQALCNSEYAQELYKRGGCVHSRLQNIETDCWVYMGGVPEKLPPKVKFEDVYFWRTAFDPDNCMPCEAGENEAC